MFRFFGKLTFFSYTCLKIKSHFEVSKEVLLRPFRLLSFTSVPYRVRCWPKLGYLSKFETGGAIVYGFQL